MPLIDFTFEDAQQLYSMSTSVESFKSGDHAGRFKLSDRVLGQETVAELLFNTDVYENGSIMWCATALEALLIYKIHTACGYSAVRMFDLWSEDNQHAVLTSYDDFTYPKNDDKGVYNFLIELNAIAKEDEIAEKADAILSRFFTTTATDSFVTGGTMFLRSTVEGVWLTIQDAQTVLANELGLPVGVNKLSD